MPVIRVRGLTVAEAEDFIARLWRALEEYRAPSTQLEVSRVAGAVDLSIRFRSQHDADLVTRVMPRLTAGAR